MLLGVTPQPVCQIAARDLICGIDSQTVSGIGYLLLRIHSQSVPTVEQILCSV